PAPGAASFNLLKMAREGLLAELRTAIHAARKNDTSVRREGITLNVDGRTKIINIDVIPFVSPHSARLFIVLFESPSAEDDHALKRRKKKGALAPPVETKQTARLKRELEATRDYLQ